MVTAKGRDVHFTFGYYIEMLSQNNQYFNKDERKYSIEELTFSEVTSRL